eukprot:sb/3465552/
MQDSHTPLYSCNYCPYKTREQVDIKRHLETECPARPPKCYTCLLCAPNVVMFSDFEIRLHFVNIHRSQPLEDVAQYPVTVGYAHDPRNTTSKGGASSAHAVCKQQQQRPIQQPARPPQMQAPRGPPPPRPPPRQPCPFEFDMPSEVVPVPPTGRPKVPTKMPQIADRIQEKIVSGGQREKEWSCQECDYKSKTWATLRNHIRNKHPRKCNLCDYTGITDEYLLSHYRSKHPGHHVHKNSLGGNSVTSQSAPVRHVTSSAAVRHVTSSAPVRHVTSSAPVRHVTSSASVGHVTSPAPVRHVTSSAAIRHVTPSAPVVRHVTPSAPHVTSSAPVRHVTSQSAPVARHVTPTVRQHHSGTVSSPAAGVIRPRIRPASTMAEKLKNGDGPFR